jgi:tetratricopeptide (TPR) repeat protein
MSKHPRNSPCTCGSGKKYKKCCLQKDKVKAIKDEVSEPHPKFSVNKLKELYAESVKLDNLSNSVVDLIDGGKLDEAEKVCSELLNRYPDQIDGLERFAMVYEARGNHEKAIEYYQQAEEFARSNEGFDSEMIDYYLNKVKKLNSTSITGSAEQKHPRDASRP